MTRTENVNQWDVSRETIADLSIYAELLLKWNGKINLISKRSELEVWSRHIEDCLQLFPLHSRAKGSWLDIGSGGGFPGLICAIAAKNERQQLTFILVESDGRKAAFLSEVVRTLSLNVEVITKRIEEVSLPPQEVISARAVASLSVLLRYSVPFCSKNTCLLFLKGAGAIEEIEEAKKSWCFHCDLIQSKTDTSGTILRLRGLRPR